ncbi:MAG: hypothetical protein ACD_22C00047G0007 [uncultured bacterium]|nr:MAG: hypothetical protein ACD_22C00047G0007 [uncultured bacterium]
MTNSKQQGFSTVGLYLRSLANFLLDVYAKNENLMKVDKDGNTKHKNIKKLP